MKPGDVVWLKGMSAIHGSGFDVLNGWNPEVIPDVPNLQAIAAFLALHPETGAALKSLLMQSPSPNSPAGREQRRIVRGLAAAIGGGE